ncbi:MAG: tRNA uridine-5-carboxymethylaminomethyl(34) synthesis GTPase MnmE [Bacteroidaceae bacterium]|nr:tRNA uridine-5-carboxymethylaminomethyl(34) synthesis GTPase MnmE [Bacteroidaceae bacterium]
MTSTICAIATATGGAIGIVRLSGSQTFDIIQRACQRITPSTPPRTAVLTPITTPEDEQLDEAIVTLYPAPHSYTGEDCAEISCHGSRYILNKVLELLVQQGAQLAQPGEFTQRAYLNGKLDLSQAEAVADLIASTNRTMHQMALSQLKGHFSSELHLLRDQLLRLTSLLELELDFSDHEELEFADRTELLTLAQTIDQRITRLANSFQTGNALKNGIPVAIVGAPNVGKSTLLNALLGEERAIVSDIQGTTRDAIEDTIQLSDITFRFIDTAGIRHTDDKIENLGIERSIAAAKRAHIIMLITEPGVPYPEIPIREDQTVIHIENKTKSFQAKYGIGLDDLCQQLIAAAPKTSDTDVIVTSARHYEALIRAHEALIRVLEGLTTQLPSDLLAEDLRLTLNALADITGGAITPQETLNNIFQHFCIGK